MIFFLIHLQIFQAGEIVAFYNGVRLPYKPGEKEDWDTSG